MGVLDESWLRTVGYAVAATAAVVAGVLERRGARSPALWPTFWFLTAAVLGAMALARALDLDGLLTELGREEVRTRGWYADRRGPQAAIVALIGATWVITVGAALWLVPERRRRYLPAAVVTFSLLCYSAIRLISLHHVDALLYRRDLAGARVGALVEIGLLLLAVALPVAACRLPRHAATT